MRLYIDHRDDVRIISINRPEVRNAVDPATATELYEAFLDFDRDDSAKIAILTGAEGAFCAGFDLKHASKGPTADWYEPLAIPEGWTDPIGDPLQAPMGPSRLMLSKPVIAAVAGPAVAGGMELAAWCDLRIVEESAYFGVFCRRWGVPLIDGGTVRIPKIVGHGRAMDLILTGRRVDADEALRIGLANRIVPDGTALNAAIELAGLLRNFPQACMRADRLSAYGAPYDLAAALRQEWASFETYITEGQIGASLFAAGKGRGGDYSDFE